MSPEDVCECGHQSQYHGVLSMACTRFDCSCPHFVLAPKIVAVVVRAGVPHREEIGSDYISMQAIVGGFFEHVALHGVWEGLDLWCHGEGLLLGLPQTLCPMYGPVAGDYFLTRHEGDETIGLEPGDVWHVLKGFDGL